MCYIVSRRLQYATNRDDNPYAAGKEVKKITDAIALLSENHAMGRIGRIAETRELIIPNSPYTKDVVKSAYLYYTVRMNASRKQKKSSVVVCYHKTMAARDRRAS